MALSSRWWLLSDTGGTFNAGDFGRDTLCPVGISTGPCAQAREMREGLVYKLGGVDRGTASHCEAVWFLSRELSSDQEHAAARGAPIAPDMRQPWKPGRVFTTVQAR